MNNDNYKDTLWGQISMKLNTSGHMIFIELDVPFKQNCIFNKWGQDKLILNSHSDGRYCGL